jgi:hypothetical protein
MTQEQRDELIDDRALMELRIAEAIWVAMGGIPRLLHEIARPGTSLHQQQQKCWAHTRAAYAATFAEDAP